MINFSKVKSPVVPFAMLLAVAWFALLIPVAHAGGFLKFKVGTRDLGHVYMYTGPTGYFDVVDSGNADVRVDTVYLGTLGSSTNDTIFHIVDTLHYWYDLSPVVVHPGKFLRVAVQVNLNDEATHQTTVTIVYHDSSDPTKISHSLTDTLSITGVGVRIQTRMEDRAAHAFETFSLPVIVTNFVDPDSLAFIQRFTCVLDYDATLIRFDTAALTIGVDSQGVCHGFEFRIDLPDTPHGHEVIHAIGKTGGIHSTGDTIFKFTFQAQQFLLTSHTTIQTTFTPDIGFLYASFSSQTCNFTTLQCSSPAKVAPAAVARFIDNHPNPFNPSTRIRYTLDVTGFVEIGVYDRIGRPVRTLIKGIVGGGEHDIVFDAEDLPSGIYICRIASPNGVDQRLISLSR